LQSLGYHQKINDSPLKVFLKDYLTISGKYYNAKNFGYIAPGGSSHYSNIASALAAYLIEVTSGMSYAKFTEKYILKPDPS
jgi:CubicO group peptidase (beta-lactamase class C family)